MFRKVELKMTIDGYYKGSGRRSHNRGKEDTKEKDIKRMS